jgi:hypothetical protein
MARQWANGSDPEQVCGGRARLGKPVFLIRVRRAAVLQVQKVSRLAAPRARFEGNKDVKKTFLQERDRAQDARADARLDWPWPHIDHSRRQLDPPAGATKVSRRATR